MATLETILGIPPEGEEKPKLEQQEAPVTQPPVQSAPPTQQPPGNGTEKPAEQPQQTQQQGGATPPPIATPTLTQQNTGRTHMSYVEMIQQMSPYKAPTEEELAKERKKQKREAIFAAIGDGLSAFHWAYSTARGTKSMVDPRVSLSGKVRDRYDKLKKERDANKSAYMSAYMKAMQMDDEGARDERNWRRTLERDRVADERDKRDFDNRVQQQETQKEQWQQSFDRQGEQWQKQFEEGKRQFNVSSAQQQQRINMEGQRLSREMQKENVTFALGTGKGTISVPTSALNASNVAYVFSKLPDEVRATVQCEAIFDSKKRKVVGHKDPTTDAMLVAIGTNIENSPEAQDALREIAGQRRQHDNGNNTPPSRRTTQNNNNTPPSRRK